MGYWHHNSRTSKKSASRVTPARHFCVYGKKLCIAGIDGVLSTTITYVPFRKRRETRLYIGGLETGTDEHLFWKDAILKTGDELRLKVVECRTVDKPRTRIARDRRAETQAQKKNVKKLARQFGWELKAKKRA